MTIGTDLIEGFKVRDWTGIEHDYLWIAGAYPHWETAGPGLDATTG